VSRLIPDLVQRAMRTRYASATVAERVKLITGRQRDVLRQILVRGLRKGDTQEAMVSQVVRFYRGVDGFGGPASMARRLVVSETTRFNGRVAEEIGQKIYEDTGRIPVYTYQTQQDEVVRDEHAAAQDEEFTDDDLAEELGMRPISEAQSLLSDINCRCWLDISYLSKSEEKAARNGDSAPKERAPRAATARETTRKAADFTSATDRKAALAGMIEKALNGGAGGEDIAAIATTFYGPK